MSDRNVSGDVIGFFFFRISRVTYFKPRDRSRCAHNVIGDAFGFPLVHLSRRADCELRLDCDRRLAVHRYSAQIVSDRERSSAGKLYGGGLFPLSDYGRRPCGERGISFCELFRFGC